MELVLKIKNQPTPVELEEVRELDIFTITVGDVQFYFDKGTPWTEVVQELVVNL